MKSLWAGCSTPAQEKSAVRLVGEMKVGERVLHVTRAQEISAVPGGGGDDNVVDGRVLHAIQLRSRVVVLCGDDDRAERHLHCCRVGYHKALASRVQSGVLVQLCVVCAVVGTHPVAPSSCRKEALQREVAKSAPLPGTSALIGAAEYAVTMTEVGSTPRHKCTYRGGRVRCHFGRRRLRSTAQVHLEWPTTP
mmetsp:Transcript_87724/g.169990  ORF Transcript_87724/g.169990 Transcript_87724/m.169990 type:complete len:193 (+) Transcript_87724:252-830(+)